MNKLTQITTGLGLVTLMAFGNVALAAPESNDSTRTDANTIRTDSQRDNDGMDYGWLGLLGLAGLAGLRKRPEHHITHVDNNKR